ncbi:pantoate--beta-alanine ligase [Mumia flava]|uniref:Pantothenate synthetase n=1 Tax=Mumia flava TaxID=1348852 RepID=A0A0B2BV66_9ACTN|nr:pantoate--beta-alanine ligase [Mumia flava]PJJ58127.1 pantoate--beta-alanine ligase [Mumia flava]
MTASAPRVVDAGDALTAVLGEARRDGRTVALVPTMGALHDGHLALVREARRRADVVVVSIFVNPTQFGPGEDLDRYPRTFDADVAALTGHADVVLHPGVEQMYPDGPQTPGVTVDPGPLGSVLEGSVRPTHFAGVLTVVAKLFGLVRPDVAVFGEKDYQQLVLIRQMARRLCLGVEVVGCPTVREPDGLALSSRNRYLDAEQRGLAAALAEALRAADAEAAHGASDALAAAKTVLAARPGVDVDYLVVRSPDLDDAVDGRPARILVAAKVGDTRLIDNLPLDLGSREETR